MNSGSLALSNQNIKIYKVAMYIRLSREDGDKDESTSITNQRNILTRFVSEHENFIIIDEYVDDGWTGTNFNRPSFKRMIADIERGKVNTVVVKDLSRLGRESSETLYYYQKYFPEQQIRFIAINDAIDTVGNSGMNEIAQFKAIMNDMYVADISKKIKSTLKELKKSGKFLGATAPYGYQKDPNNKHQLIVYEEEANVVKHIFDLYLTGNGLTKIAKILTEEGIPVPGLSRNVRPNNKTKLYDCWKQTTISRILRNQVYIGNLEQAKRKNVSYNSKKRVTVPKEERIYCENTHEPIIEKSKFYQVQDMINHNSSFKGVKHDYLFKGFLYCAECGAKLQLTYSNYALKKYGEYRYTTICYTYSKLYNMCSRHSNNIALLEEVLISNIKNVCKAYLDKDLKGNLFTLAENKLQENDEKVNFEQKIAILDSKIDEKMRMIKSLYEDKFRGIISENDFLEMSKQFAEERQSYIDEKEKLLLKSVQEKQQPDHSKEIKKLVKEFISFDKPPKILLQQLIEKITISEENEVVIYFKFKELNNISKMAENKILECKTVNKRNTKAS